MLNNNKDNLGKLDAKADEGIFLGYSTSSKANRIFNKHTLVVEESVHVVFVESNVSLRRDDIDIVDLEKETPQSNIDLPKALKFVRNHHIDQVIGNVEKVVRTHSSYNQASNFALLSQIEPKNISEAKDD